jgi:hypothetical protein
VRRVRTPTLPRVAPDPVKLAAIKAHYLQQYFSPPQPERTPVNPPTPPPVIGRRSRGAATRPMPRERGDRDGLVYSMREPARSR